MCCREIEKGYFYGFVHFMMVNGMLTSRHMLSSPALSTFEEAFGIEKAVSGKEFRALLAVDKAYRRRLYFQVPLTIPMKYDDIPVFLEDLQAAWRSKTGTAKGSKDEMD